MQSGGLYSSIKNKIWDLLFMSNTIPELSTYSLDQQNGLKALLSQAAKPTETRDLWHYKVNSKATLQANSVFYHRDCQPTDQPNCNR